MIIFNESFELNKLIEETLIKYPSGENNSVSQIVANIQLMCQNYDMIHLENTIFMKKIFLDLFATKGYPARCCILSDLWDSIKVNIKNG